ncbi:MAG: tripartite tricarboxylate transporter substrate binding protein [Polaromonas sp.]
MKIKSLNFPGRQLVHHAVAVLALVTGGVCWAQAVANESYPDRAVKIVVGFAPGGTNDIVARAISIKLQDRLKQPFVVENKPGASSAIGTDFVAKAKPDGYTLLVSSSGGLTVNPVLMASLPYKPERDFEPVALLGTFPLVVTANARLPFNSLAGMVAYAKNNKGGVIDHGVASTSFQLVAEMLGGATGVKFNHVNYRGSGPTVVALLGGEIQLALLDSASVMSQVKAGKLKALAVTTGQRSSAFPDLPTVAESGFKGYDAPIWTALMAPKGTPEPVLAKLRTAMKDILKEKDMIEKMRTLGMDAGNTDGPALNTRISDDIKRWGEIAKRAGIKPE